ncbi:MAG: HAMP domain-containing protein [Candidatus Omnitrophica bacterium]|nr:HAMP domain-containing protein [Candidatus Omnitrophota bacterium]
MFLQSIRFKIFLWQMLILSLTFFIFGVALYHNFHRKLTDDIDYVLRSRAKGIEQSIDTYWQEESRQKNKNILKGYFIKEDNINFVNIARRWVSEKNSDPNLINLIVRIFDAGGGAIASSRNVRLDRLEARVFHQIKKGHDHFENMEINLSGKPLAFRSFTTPVIENKRLAYIVQVASPLAELDQALRNLGVSLLFLLPLTIIVTSVTGIFLVQLTLRPVHQMIDTIHQIKAENLKLRLDIPPTKDEIESLAITFNDMIARLDEAFCSQRQFMEDISHELKTPLSILKGELEVTLKRIRSAQEYETTLHSSLEEINHLAHIVENLLVLARFDAKTTPLQAMPLDISLLIKESMEDIVLLAQQKKITLHLNNAHTDAILGDKNQIKRLFLNILDNAIKYTPEGGKITVDLRQQKNDLDIDISDTGIGIPSDELAYIFDRFYRVDKSRSSSGFGLGLSIAQSIALAHGGKIYVKPNIPQGTIFTITFPLSVHH